MKSKIIACCALALLLGACSSNKTETTSTGTTAPESMATMASTMMASHMKSVTMMAQNGSGETGTATLTSMGNKTSVLINIKGEAALGKQPAHIHLGTCAKLDPAPKYPLKDVVLGKSVTIVDESMSELTSAPMAINVHDSAADLKKYVACGDIKK